MRDTGTPTPRRHDERGATAVEYALLALLIAAVIVGVMLFFGDDVLGLFRETQASVEDAVDP